MALIAGFQSNAALQPVEYVGEVPGNFGEPDTPGTYEPIARRPPIPAVALDIPSAEKVQAGIDVATPAKTCYFNLVSGGAPVTERDTVEMNGARWNVRSVVKYDVAGFDRAGYAEIVRL